MFLKVVIRIDFGIIFVIIKYNKFKLLIWFSLIFILII